MSEGLSAFRQALLNGLTNYYGAYLELAQRDERRAAA